MTICRLICEQYGVDEPEFKESEWSPYGVELVNMFPVGVPRDDLGHAFRAEFSQWDEASGEIVSIDTLPTVRHYNEIFLPQMRAQEEAEKKEAARVAAIDRDSIKVYHDSWYTWVKLENDPDGDLAQRLVGYGFRYSKRREAYYLRYVVDKWSVFYYLGIQDHEQKMADWNRITAVSSDKITDFEPAEAQVVRGIFPKLNKNDHYCYNHIVMQQRHTIDRCRILRRVELNEEQWIWFCSNLLMNSSWLGSVGGCGSDYEVPAEYADVDDLFQLPADIQKLWWAELYIAVVEVVGPHRQMLVNTEGRGYPCYAGYRLQEGSDLPVSFMSQAEIDDYAKHHNMEMAES